jgi:hypothetical protein
VDLERELRRVLLERPLLPEPEGDVVAAVQAGMRRRVRRQRLSLVGAAAGVLALWGGAVLLLQPSTTPRPTVRTTVITNVPHGFEARDLTFVSTERGYALGTAPCGRAACTVLLQTDTGTEAWERAPGPLVGAPRPDGTGCAGRLCVSQVRFATTSTGEEVGYAYGPSYVVFQDGEWHPQFVGHAVEALEAGKAGTVVRVLARPGGGHLVQQSTVGSSVWRDVLDVTVPTHHAVLRRQGARLVLVTFDDAAGGGRGGSDVWSSTDGGTTWRKGAHDPCGQDGVASVALGRQQDVLALCTRRAGGSYLRLSVDDGTRFGPARELPAGLTASQVAAPAAGGWLVAGDVADADARVVVRSRDEGLTWERSASETAPPGRAATGYLDNSDSRTVWWVGADPRSVWRSDDGGAHWTVARFS